MTVEITRDLVVERLGRVKYDRFLFYRNQGRVPRGLTPRVNPDNPVGEISISLHRTDDATDDVIRT